ncbi:response regulator [Piscinibacter sp. XHJ-5]|uniref:response regulator n=1 Tax=Piscinibacter sp. XHJ-5 TaxID=3037797 RepID=UPI002452AD08|nr:response regulator [Piscinibacter sp. XHJ-5]
MAVERRDDDSSVILSTSPAGPADRRTALIVVLVSAAGFLAALPFAKLPLLRVWAFIPIYQSALVLTDLMTAVLLFGQFSIVRSRALLVLAGGYVFTALMAAAHAMTFPGLFTPQGLLGAGPQSTAWLYMFWHGGFPLFVIAYAQLKDRQRSVPHAAARTLHLPLAATLGGAAAATLAFTAVATAGQETLPEIMAGNRYRPVFAAVVGLVWAASLMALLLLWRRRPHSMLDLWLVVVMAAWLFDIGLAAVFNAGRFDLGFYAGRIYGLLAASFVLVMMLLENSRLYARLVRAHEREQVRSLDAQRLSAQLEAANAALAAQNEQLEEASRLKSEFLSTMSHELRTPLNAVIGFSEVMKDGLTGQLTAQQGGYIGHIFQSGQHLLALINDILDLSKIEAGRVELELSPVDLDALLDDAIALLSEKAKAGQVRLRRESHEPIGGLLADRRRLQQIVLNLLSNAIKFTPEHGQVVLQQRLVDRAQAANGMPGAGGGVRMTLPENTFTTFVEITITDTGIGIGADDARKLFAPFTQIANQLTRRSEGTGLGLAMVKRLAELHGGTVAVTSEPGRGSCFTVWLPWRETELPAARGTPAASRAHTGDGPLALVVEDDDEAATLMRLQLEAEGFRVRIARSAEAALQWTGELMPDVISVDIQLPGIDGWELIERLQRVPAWAQIPVVVVSVMPDHRRGFSLGASLVLQKPVVRDALSRGLARLGLVPSSERDVTVLVIDDDPAAVELLAVHLRQTGHTVLRALSGAEGIELARRYRPDLIALDLEMPGVNGFDVVDTLSAHPATANIPVVIVTAQQLTPEMRRRLNGHIHEIVDKAGFNGGRFMGEVKRALASKRP